MTTAWFIEFSLAQRNGTSDFHDMFNIYLVDLLLVYILEDFLGVNSVD